MGNRARFTNGKLAVELHLSFQQDETESVDFTEELVVRVVGIKYLENEVKQFVKAVELVVHYMSLFMSCTHGK